MTRKQALLKAIKIIDGSNISNEEKSEIKSKLNLCVTELPFAKWTKEAVFDACDQYCIDQKRTYLISSDFIKAELPSHPTIKNRFGMDVSEFRDEYYPLPNRKGHKWYSKKTHKEYTDDFIEQYIKIKPRSADEYNKKRPKGYPTWIIIAKMNDVNAWLPLLNKLNLNLPKEKEFRVISYSESGNMEYLREKFGSLPLDRKVKL